MPSSDQCENASTQIVPAQIEENQENDQVGLSEFTLS